MSGTNIGALETASNPKPEIPKRKNVSIPNPESNPKSLSDKNPRSPTPEPKIPKR